MEDNNMISKDISEKDFNKFKNIIEDNKKISNIKHTIESTTDSVEGLLVRMGDLLQDLHEVKMEVNDIESRLHEKFELKGWAREK